MSTEERTRYEERGGNNGEPENEQVMSSRPDESDADPDVEDDNEEDDDDEEEEDEEDEDDEEDEGDTTEVNDPAAEPGKPI